MTGFTVTDEAEAIRREYIESHVQRKINRVDGDYTPEQLEAWEAQAAEWWAKRWPALEAAARTAQPAPASPTADDYVRATAEAVGIDPDEAVAYRHHTVAANAAWRAQREVQSPLTATREKLTEALAREILRQKGPGPSWDGTIAAGQQRLLDQARPFADALLASGVVQEASAQPTPVVDEKRLAEMLSEVHDHTLPWSYTVRRLLAAGVFQSEAEVRATAIEEVAEAYLYDGDRDSQLPGYVALIECAAAIRAGGQA